MTRETLLALLQLGDGLFPAGGFAHSFGLETYAQEGRVRDRVGLEGFVTAHLEGAAGPGDAVAVAVAARLGPPPRGPAGGEERRATHVNTGTMLYPLSP